YEINKVVTMVQIFRHLLGGTLAVFLLAGIATAMPVNSYPADAKTGQCFARVLTADTVETVTERIEVHPAVTRQRMIPAVFERQRIRVMVKEASYTYTTIPPVYETIYEEVLIKPHEEYEVTIPAQYETWTETIEVEPAKLVWKSGQGLYGRDTLQPAANTADQEAVATGEILCRVLQPAKTRRVRHTRMISPARTEKRIIPAEYKTVAKQVVKRPSHLERVAVPAEYASIPFEKEVRPARMEVETIPATYQDITRQVVRHSGALEWAEVLCDSNTNRLKIAEIQTALTAHGYEIAIDGIYGPQTQAAMERYQREQGLAAGYMTVETVQALNVDPYRCEPPSCTSSLPQTTVAATQEALTAAGYYAEVDGIHGPQTQQAMEAFQEANGLQVGYLSAETMDALNILALI
ncbi:MAG: peptidoglycan-binding protein, partial [Pseudomonadota bacterium]